MFKIELVLQYSLIFHFSNCSIVKEKPKNSLKILNYNILMEGR